MAHFNLETVVARFFDIVRPFVKNATGQTSEDVAT
jgi:hypothetical protein